MDNKDGGIVPKHTSENETGHRKFICLRTFITQKMKILWKSIDEVEETRYFHSFLYTTNLTKIMAINNN